MQEITVPRGTPVFVSIFNANRNTDLWGEGSFARLNWCCESHNDPSLDADEWKPERWFSPLPDALVDARIPGIYSHM